MREISKFSVLRFFSYLTMFTFLTLMLFFAENNLSVALQLAFLTWSFYILCIPAFHGRITLGIPYQILTGKILLYPEVYVWIGAVAFNLFEMTQYPNIYFKTFITHFLYQILSTPQIQWLIIAACALGTFYKLFVGYQNFYDRKVLHYFIRMLLIALGVFALIQLSYKELIILINIRT